MQIATQQKLNRDEYLELDIKCNERYEFYQGEIFLMSGGTFNHATISGNIFSTLKNYLRGKTCQPLNSDMRIHTPSGLDTYPDVCVYCDTPQLQDKQHTLLNPIAIFEVLSPSTRDYDRGDKVSLYSSIPTLKDYILVDSQAILVEHYQRMDKSGWILQEYGLLTDAVYIATMEMRIYLKDIYELVVW